MAENPSAARALPEFRAMILDMDGLLLDSEATYCEAWRRAAADTGHRLETAFLESLFGRHADDVVLALAERLGPDFEQAPFFAAAERHWFALIDAQGIPQMPGAETLLDLLRRRGIPYALATNSDGPYARRCLERGGLSEAIPVLVTRDQVPQGKPEPDLFLEAARRLNVDPADCVVLEDSETGLLAARAAGTCPILIQCRAVSRTRLKPLARLSLPSLYVLVTLLDNQIGASNADREAVIEDSPQHAGLPGMTLLSK